ncbi:hypothetical protein [Cupriavidus necator]
MSDDQKFGLTVLAVLGCLIFVATKAIGMDLGIPDLVQLATDLLRRLFY